MRAASEEAAGAGTSRSVPGCPAVTLKQLRCFIEIFHCGKIGTAAERWRERSLITVRSGDGIRRLFNEAVMRSGIDLTPAYEVRLLNTALAMTAQGLGVAILPGLLVARSVYSGLATRRLTQPVIERSILMARLRGKSLSPAAQAFSELVRSAFKAL